MDVTVFYAWQDDRPGKMNRYLIRDAAKDACQRISDDRGNDFTVHLDQDTEGRPGMCDIPNTILEKIRDCDVLLADLTFVGRTDAEAKHQKQISNPNVLMELGYAVGCKATDESDGFERVIGVMNVAYGKPEEQMFDIKRRRPMSYELPEGSDKDRIQRVASSLSKSIEDALRTILNDVVLPGKNSREENAENRFQDVRREFESSVRDGSFHGLRSDSAAIAICVVPDTSANLQQSRLRQLPLVSPLCSALDVGRDQEETCVVFFRECSTLKGPNAVPVRCSVAEVDVGGVIRVADTFLLDAALNRHPQDVGRVVPQKRLEECVSPSVVQYGRVLKQLQIRPPWRLAVSLLGIRGYRMWLGGSVVGKALNDTETLCADPIVIRGFDEVSNETSARRVLKGSFDYFAGEFDMPRC
jgi:hypothetical protein